MGKDLMLEDLGQYFATESYHNVMGVSVTDGVAYVMECGYSWFVTDAIVNLRMKEKLKNQEFLAVKLKLKGSKAVVNIEDGNGNVLNVQKYEYTDAKKELCLYYTNNVLMLSGEY